jgi:hypothetical protein
MTAVKPINRKAAEGSQRYAEKTFQASKPFKAAENSGPQAGSIV